MPEEERMVEEECGPEEEGMSRDSMSEQQHPTKSKPQG